MKSLNENPYVQDILSQPESLQAALTKFDNSPLKPLADTIQRGDIDRIILTGMGASLYAAYPAWLTLAQAGLPAMWVDTAELIHHAPELITKKTLYWLFSQSGRSAEIVSALNFDLLQHPRAMFGTVNDLVSPLAKAITEFDGLSGLIPINAIVENTVSTRTFVNSLALSELAALTLTGQDIISARDALEETADYMQTYLQEWESHLQEIRTLLGFPKRLAILARGKSLAAANTGALILGEAAKFLVTSFQAGEFRHGPLELAGPALSVFILAGSPKTRELNSRLLKDLRNYKTNAFWVGANVSEWQIWVPEVPEIGVPLVEILPIQLLSIHLAQQTGVEPGHFFHSGKITLSE